MKSGTRTFGLAISREIDPDKLATLSARDADRAGDEGYLAGNQHYCDLRACTWSDLRKIIEQEDRELGVLAEAQDQALAEEQLRESRGSSFDPFEDVWALDIGVAAAVAALSALGATTVSSCNGGAFGTAHQAQFPYVAFYVSEVPLRDLVEFAAESGLGLSESDGLVRLYANRIDDMLTFARRVIQSHGGM